ncbi:uncharacterized protein CCDC197 [Rhineura floridana]|uniref:uncharacterized protein CCDC197 n=1 Tax=Rhineura floridana TaxID=261503 RepID=UPI002AC89186|nr:uncharacterized protein CCDC197 [Rhineura floridana]
MAALMMIRDNDPQYFLQAEDRRRNFFLTQLGEHREDESDVPQIPIMREASSEILRHRRKALETFQLLKKGAENEKFSAELAAKKQEFQEKMEVLAQRRGALEQKDQENKAQALEFDVYLKECQLKKARAFQKYHQEQKRQAMKRRELFKLKKELKKLNVRLQELRKKMAKYKKYEDFLQNVINALLPGEYNFLGGVEDSVVKALIKRHKALCDANQNLMKNLSTQLYNLEKTQSELNNLHEEHSTATVMLISKISAFQSKQNALQEKNIRLYQYINYNEGFSSEKRQELSRMLLAISNLAEQCYLWHYGPLDKMPLLSKLDMIQEFIVGKTQVKEETKTLQSRELERSSCNLLKEMPSSALSKEQLKKQISFCQ